MATILAQQLPCFPLRIGAWSFPVPISTLFPMLPLPNSGCTPSHSPLNNDLLDLPIPSLSKSFVKIEVEDYLSLL